MNWGSVANWVLIIASALMFIVSQAVIYALLRRDVKSNKVEIAKMGSEIEGIKSREVTLKTMAACLDKAIENEKEIEELKKAVITKPLLDTAQAGCRADLLALIKENARDTDDVRDGIKEIKKSMWQQDQHLGKISVSLAELNTKIDERTERRASKREEE